MGVGKLAGAALGNAIRLPKEKTNMSGLLGAAAGVAGQGLGLLMQGHNDRRQIRQQEKLNNLQIKGNKEMADYQKGLDLQMWKDTNYGAQVQQMKEAGLSISGMYGGSGAGGATTGGGGGSGVSGGNAADAAATQQAQTGMAMQAAQLALLGAQKKNIDADTANKEAGVTGTIAGAEKAGSETALNEQQLSEAKQSRDARMQTIAYGAQEQIAKAKEAFNRGEISEQTQQAVVKRTQAEAIGAGIENLVMQQGIKLSQAQIRAIGENVLQGWKGLEIQQQNATTNKRFANVAELTQLVNESMGRANVSQKIHELDQRQMEALQKLATDIVGLGTGQGATSTSEWGENAGGEWYRETRTKKN